MRATDLSRGTRVAARFSIEGLTDRGASGAVYRARDLETNAIVALKVIVSDTPEQHFAREARILEGLRHPAIVSYVAHGTTDDGRVYLALEWLEGDTLSRHLHDGPLSVADALLVTRAVAEALAYAHARGVIHRDIKPSNIFVTSDGDVKLIDFGIAQLHQGTRITRTGVTMGTPAYMAPEQARAAAIDGRADIFSLGCVLYRCLAGTTPFGAENLTATLAKVLFEEPAPLRSRRREVPFEVEALVSRMLAKDPAERVPSAAALVAEIERAPTELHGTSVPPADASGPSLTLTERRFVSVVLARPDDGEDLEIPDVTADATQKMEAFDARASRSDRGPTPQAQIVRLVNGTLAATFAGPSAVDHAAQAARCALLMQKWLPNGHIVVTTGLAVVEERLPMGEVIERAAQMLDRGPGKLDGIRVDGLSARLLEARFDVIRDGDDSVLLGERRARAEPRTLLGKPSPHVGRERELAALVGLLEECVAESTPRCAIVTGAAGLGKSRLLSELVDRTRQQHPSMVTWIARGDQMSVGSSFALTADLVRDATQARRGDPVDALGAMLGALLDRCGADAHERDRVAATLATLASERATGDDLTSDPRSYGDRLFAAYEDFVRLVARSSTPLLVVLDDLQWGDLATVRLIAATMRNLQNTPFCVLAAGRPDLHERFPNLWSERSPLSLPLSDLSPRAARRVVTSILGDVDEALVARIVERAAGNALHLEELVRAVAEGRGGSLPETVLAMVAERLQSLDPEARRLLRAASVFGETFWEQSALALLGDTEVVWTEYAERLAELVRRELVVREPTSQFEGDVEYRFRHSLLREAAYATLTDADRVVGHRIAAEWLVAAGSADTRALAEHFALGDMPARAAGYYVRAAQQALLGGDVAAVLELCGRARACDPSTHGPDLARLAAEAHSWQADFARAEAAAATCLTECRTDDPLWWSCAAIVVVACLKREGWDRGAPVYESMLTAPFQPAIAATQIVATARVVVHLCAAGRFTEADDLMAAVGALLARLATPNDVVLGAVRAAEGMRALCAGDIASYRAAMSETAILFERGGDLRNACNAECNVGFCGAELGVYAEAEPVLRDALARARRLGLTAIEYNALHNLGFVLFRLGRIEEARAIELDCANVFEKKGDGRTAGGSRLYLALIALETGALDEAEAEVARALALLVETPPVRAFGLAVLAHVHLARGRVAEACATAAESSALLDELGAMEQGEAFVRLAAVEALRAGGDLEGARSAAAIARARLLERGAIMTDPALRESFFTRVPENARTFELARELGV